MFLKFGGQNFFCFKEDFEVDLRLNKNCPENISRGLDVAKVMCIKGANAAGKTNSLKALSFICDFMTNSFSKKPDEKISIESFFNNNQDIKLFCEFRLDDLEYRYEIELTSKAVKKEILRFARAPEKVLFERRGDQILFLDDSFLDIQSIPQLRGNASLVSIANQHEIKSLSRIYQFFKKALSNVAYVGFKDLLTNDIHEFYHTAPEALSFVKDLIIRFDTGISDIVIDSYEDSEGNEIYYPVFVFDINGEKETLRYSHQSSGTKRLYHLLGFIFLVLEQADEKSASSLFIADELDLHLHSKILPELIKLFDESKNSQLIFSCQNDEILNDLGKYRAILVSKDENESFSYRLDELPSDVLRNNRPITPHYQNERIGGVPKIG